MQRGARWTRVHVTSLGEELHPSRRVSLLQSQSSSSPDLASLYIPQELECISPAPFSGTWHCFGAATLSLKHTVLGQRLYWNARLITSVRLTAATRAESCMHAAPAARPWTLSCSDLSIRKGRMQTNWLVWRPPAVTRLANHASRLLLICLFISKHERGLATDISRLG